MTILQLRDGTDLYYKDWGAGRPILFSHGWPLSADMWESQQLFFASRGWRAIAFDRRGFGRSSQPWTGYDYDTFADDIGELIEALDLRDLTLVGFSMGGGDVLRYTARNTGRVARLALVSAVTPIFGKTADHPEGVDRSVFDGIRKGLEADRAQFIDDFGTVFYGTNRPGSTVSKGVLTQTLQIALQASLKGTLDCVTAFSETDFRGDAAKVAVPTLVIHGDDDQVVPFEATGALAARLIPHATLKVYAGGPHATHLTHRDQLNADLLAFVQG